MKNNIRLWISYTHGPTCSVMAVTTATQVHVPLSSSLLVKSWLDSSDLLSPESSHSHRGN